MVFRAQRRFIAGAVCPRCSAMDKLVVFKEGDNTFRECVNCGYRQEMEFSPALKPLPTRVDPVKETPKISKVKVGKRETLKPKLVKPEVIKIVHLNQKD